MSPFLGLSIRCTPCMGIFSSFFCPPVQFCLRWYLCAQKSLYVLHPVSFRLMMALSCPFKEDHQVLSCFMPLSPKMHTHWRKKERKTTTNNKGNIFPLSQCIWYAEMYSYTHFFLFLCGWNNKLLIYWAIQRSWFARVNALCNLSRKTSREVAAHFRADI